MLYLGRKGGGGGGGTEFAVDNQLMDDKTQEITRDDELSVTDEKRKKVGRETDRQCDYNRKRRKVKN